MIALIIFIVFIAVSLFFVFIASFGIDKLLNDILKDDGEEGKEKEE